MARNLKYSDEELLELLREGFSDYEIAFKKLILSAPARYKYEDRVRKLREKHNIGHPEAIKTVSGEGKVEFNIHYGKNRAAKIAQEVRVDVGAFMEELAEKEAQRERIEKTKVGNFTWLEKPNTEDLF